MPYCFSCNPDGETNWLINFKVQVYADEAGATLVSEIDSVTNQLFKITLDNATWSSIPKMDARRSGWEDGGGLSSGRRRCVIKKER